MNAHKHRVVIVGGGVGGLGMAKRLTRNSLYESTLISKKRTFDHKTSLYRTKRGTSRRHITVPLQQVFRRRSDLDLVRAEITNIDPKTQKITSQEGLEYEYDSLIVALEGEAWVPDKFDTKATYSAYSASEMDSLRRRLIVDFEQGQVDETYVVVGSGETGVEIAYELRLLIDSLCGKGTQRPQVLLLESQSRVLPRSPEKISRRVAKKLRRAGITVQPDVEVLQYQDGALQVAKPKKTISARVVILATGQKANHFFAENEDTFLLDDDRRVRVNELQEAEGFNNIYIIGNSKASSHRYGTEGMLYDAHYIDTLLDCKRYGKEIPRYEPPSYELHMQLGHGWAVYQSGVRVYSGLVGWIRKRWLDRSHFSTLLPTRLWLRIWVFGSQHNEIR